MFWGFELAVCVFKYFVCFGVSRSSEQPYEFGYLICKAYGGGGRLGGWDLLAAQLTQEPFPCIISPVCARDCVLTLNFAEHLATLCLAAPS